MMAMRGLHARTALSLLHLSVRGDATCFLYMQAKYKSAMCMLAAWCLATCAHIARTSDASTQQLAWAGYNQQRNAAAPQAAKEAGGEGRHIGDVLDDLARDGCVAAGPASPALLRQQRPLGHGALHAALQHAGKVGA